MPSFFYLPYPREKHVSKEKDFALKILWSMFLCVVREDRLMKGNKNKTLQDGLERKSRKGGRNYGEARNRE